METYKTVLKSILILTAALTSIGSANASCMCICQNSQPRAVCEYSNDMVPDCSLNVCPMQGMQGMQSYQPYQPTQQIQPDNSDPYHMRNNFPNPWK